jgi:hypothetical protein
MKKILLSILFAIITLTSLACHESYVTLVSGPTSIGGGQYSTTVQVCIGQTVNWGGTLNFTMTVAGATFASYAPAALSNTYNAYKTASCAGPNCFMGGCGSVTANATSTSTATVVTYTTSSSVPAGFPLVPDDVETCGANPISYCFNFTFVTNGVPTSISLGGNVENRTPSICRITCGHSATYAGGPCNGSYDPSMTLLLGSTLPVELVDFYVENKIEVNNLSWVTASELNNDYFIVENSTDGYIWDIMRLVNGAGNSTTKNTYELEHRNYKEAINYYRLTQVDFDGNREVFKTIAIDNSKEKKTLVRTVNLMGQDVDENYKGLVINLYSDGTTNKELK